MKAYGWKRCLAPFFLHSDTNGRRVVRSTPRPPYPGERDTPVPIEYYNVRVPDDRSGRFREEKILPCRTSNPGPGVT